MNNLRTQSACQFLVAAALLHLNACESMTTQDWRSASTIEHPLTSKIWDTSNQQMVTPDALLERMAQARYVFLGETHDNEEHHRIQAKVLQDFIARGDQPALAMEQFDTEYQSSISEMLTTKTSTADSIANAGHLNRKGWNWSFYEPLVSRAREAKLPIIAINLSRSRARNIAHQGLNAVEDESVKRLLLVTTWNQRQNDTLHGEIVQGHCGNVPEELLPKLVIAQRARDATMANALVSRTAGSTVVILGREHARKDVGAPIYLARDASFISVALVEVEPNRNTPSDYLTPAQEAQAFDFVWFTSAAQRKDPCADALTPSPG